MFLSWVPQVLLLPLLYQRRRLFHCRISQASSQPLVRNTSRIAGGLCIPTLRASLPPSCPLVRHNHCHSISDSMLQVFDLKILSEPLLRFSLRVMVPRTRRFSDRALFPVPSVSRASLFGHFVHRLNRVRSRREVSSDRARMAAKQSWRLLCFFWCFHVWLFRA